MNPAGPRAPRYVVATSGLGPFSATIYRRGPSAADDDAVEIKVGFRTRRAAREWGRERIAALGAPA